MGKAFNVKLNLNGPAVKARIQADCDKGIAVISNEALKDANRFVRFDSGELMRSSIRASQPEKGRLVWDTPYAKRMYYVGHPVTDVNPEASLMWAHKGYTVNREKYLRMLKKLRGGATNGLV